MTVASYQNPILRGMYPDPSIVRVEKNFYLVNSTFEYYPGIALSKSNDLLNWTKLPGIAVLSSQADLRSAQSNEGIFAACIRYHAGHFYVITTNFAEWKTFIIRGTFTADKQSIVWDENRTEVDIPGIDPDLYFEDGHAYVQYTGYVKESQKAISQVEIDLETGNILTGPEILTFGTGGRDVEGPHIIKKDGWYYLLAAEGGTGAGHMITMFRSRKLWGPYESEPGINPLFTNRDRAEKPLQNIGHADLFQDASGNWWLTTLGTRPTQVGFMQFTNTGRETLLYPVDWGGDWPVIYNGIPEETVDLKEFPAHAAALAHPQRSAAFTDDFSSEELNPEWVTLRDDLGPHLTVGNGKLVLLGKQTTLSDIDTPAFVAVRQTEHNEVFSVQLDRNATHLGTGKAGIAVTINASHYAALLLKSCQEGGYDVFRFQKVLDLEVCEKLGHLDELPETLSVTNTDAQKKFSAKTAYGQELNFSTDAIHFSNEAICALNTGVMQGIYALGNSRIAVDHAERRAIVGKK